MRWPFQGRRSKNVESVSIAPPPVPRSRLVSVVGSKSDEEIKEYLAVCKKVKLTTPAIRMLKLRQFLAQRGIPEYDHDEVHEHLAALTRAQGEKVDCMICPLREKDRDIVKGLLWRWRSNGEGPFDSTDKVYHKLVPGSVLQTVETIHEAFPDARFFVTDIPDVDDPFLFVTFADQEFVIVDFWEEPGFKPVKMVGVT